jgi:hypothetical protein
MARAIKIKFRPGQEKQDRVMAARVYVSERSMMELTGALKAGQACFVEDPNRSQSRRDATLWVDKQLNSTSTGTEHIARTTSVFREAGAFNFQDEYRIGFMGAEVDVAESVTLEDTTDADSPNSLSISKEALWKAAVSSQLQGVWCATEVFRLLNV